MGVFNKSFSLEARRGSNVLKLSKARRLMQDPAGIVVLFVSL